MIAGLTFSPVDHEYQKDGVRVPSVTQILAVLNNWHGIDPDVLARKGELGSFVHAATELVDEKALDDDSVADDAKPYIAAYRQWRAEMQPIVLESEQRVYCDQHKYAGTFDRVVHYDSADWMVDIKTSAIVHAASGPQTAAYAAAYVRTTGQVLKRAVLQLRPDGTYRWVEKSSSRDLNVFRACHVIHNFNRGNQ